MYCTYLSLHRPSRQCWFICGAKRAGNISHTVTTKGSKTPAKIRETAKRQLVTTGAARTAYSRMSPHHGKADEDVYMVAIAISSSGWMSTLQACKMVCIPIANDPNSTRPYHHMGTSRYACTASCQSNDLQGHARRDVPSSWHNEDQKFLQPGGMMSGMNPNGRHYLPSPS